MISGASKMKKITIPLASVIAAVLVTSCAVSPPPPEKVDESRPTVTYKYSSDQELVEVRPRAENFCARYQSVPRTRDLSTAPDGKRVVVFECVQTLAPVRPLPPRSDLTYTYSSDRELLDAIQMAHTYCRKNGARDVVSNITTRRNGVKVVRFRCSPA
jgi:hypothetical protein